jgi:hypothetical protein
MTSRKGEESLLCPDKTWELIETRIITFKYATSEYSNDIVLI